MEAWLVPTLLVAAALAMDALAVAAAQGAAYRPALPQTLAMAGAFGAAQGLMPLAGWAIGALAIGLISALDHWIALGLLGFLGIRMIFEGFAPSEEPRVLTGAALLAAAVATSIDAFAAGITLPVLQAPVLPACALIAAVTFGLSWAGVRLGAAAGASFGRYAEILGGLLLIAIGLRIFVEHQFLGG